MNPTQSKALVLARFAGMIRVLDRTVVSLMGDGGFGMTTSEIGTAVSHDIRTICVVMNKHATITVIKNTMSLVSMTPRGISSNLFVMLTYWAI